MTGIAQMTLRFDDSEPEFLIAFLAPLSLKSNIVRVLIRRVFRSPT